nr:hypothetical protein [Tanacetum cinerariifolium]
MRSVAAAFGVAALVFFVQCPDMLQTGLSAFSLCYLTIWCGKMMYEKCCSRICGGCSCFLHVLTLVDLEHKREARAVENPELASYR